MIPSAASALPVGVMFVRCDKYSAASTGYAQASNRYLTKVPFGLLWWETHDSDELNSWQKKKKRKTASFTWSHIKIIPKKLHTRVSTVKTATVKVTRTLMVSSLQVTSEDELLGHIELGARGNRARIVTERCESMRLPGVTHDIQTQKRLCAPTRGPHASSTHATRPPSYLS